MPLEKTILKPYYETAGTPPFSGIAARGTDLWHHTKHGVPKQVVSLPNGKSYYIDIRPGEGANQLWEAKTDAPGIQRSWFLGDKKIPQFVTAVCANEDGNLFVATQQGLMMVRPPTDPAGEPEIINLGKVPGVDENVRVNNMNVVDGKLFIGTALIAPDKFVESYFGAQTTKLLPNAPTVANIPKDDRPGKLFVFDPKDLKFVEIAKGFGAVNAITGVTSAQLYPGNTNNARFVTFSDASTGVAQMYLAEYKPQSHDLNIIKDRTFTAEEGRPDGANPIMWKNPGTGQFEAVFAVAMIDQPRIAFLNSKLEEVGAVALPPHIKKPTMPSFRTTEDGNVEMIITTLEPKTESAEYTSGAGNIYSITLSGEHFQALDQVAKYPAFNEMVTKVGGGKFTGRVAARADAPATINIAPLRTELNDVFHRALESVQPDAGDAKRFMAFELIIGKALDYAAVRLLEAAHGPHVEKAPLGQAVLLSRAELNGELAAYTTEHETIMAAIDKGFAEKLEPLIAARRAHGADTGTPG